MREDQLRAYARLLLQTGVNLQRGQRLAVTFSPDHRAFVRVLWDEAYRLGASYVHPRPVYDDLARIRVDRSEPDGLDEVPAWQTEQDRVIVDQDWATLALVGSDDPHAFDGADPARLGRLEQAAALKNAAYRQAMMRFRFRWSVAAFPTPCWARQVLGPSAGADDLWNLLVPIYALDQPDPVAFWNQKLRRLQDRAESLNRLALDALHFEGPGTDLRVGLLPGSRWIAGGETSPSGHFYAPNLPTEEAFTTPDWRRTEGRVAVTRGVEVSGVEVEGARFTFREGRVVDFEASRGREVLGQFLTQDGQANAVGEIALVDASSAVAASGQTFHSILFDENAACHLALGAGYPSAVREESDGVNVSQVHTDFMIGSPEVSVTGLGRDGRRVPLLVNGRFVAGLS